MPGSRTCLPTINYTPRFKWIDSGMRYLGIQYLGMQYLGICLTPAINDMIQTHFFPLLQIVKANLDKWKLINLSLWGKVTTTEIIATPQLNYISMMVPLTVPDSPRCGDSSNLRWLDILTRQFPARESREWAVRFAP